jgi:hypothetical protein
MEEEVNGLLLSLCVCVLRHLHGAHQTGLRIAVQAFAVV